MHIILKNESMSHVFFNQCKLVVVCHFCPWQFLFIKSFHLASCVATLLQKRQIMSYHKCIRHQKEKLLLGKTINTCPSIFFAWAAFQDWTFMKQPYDGVLSQSHAIFFLMKLKCLLNQNLLQMHWCASHSWSNPFPKLILVSAQWNNCHACCNNPEGFAFGMMSHCEAMPSWMPTVATKFLFHHQHLRTVPQGTPMAASNEGHPLEHWTATLVNAGANDATHSLDVSSKWENI